MPDHHHQRTPHVYKPSPLFYQNGDKVTLRDVYEPPYQRIFRLKVWLSLSLLLNFALAITVYYLLR